MPADPAHAPPPPHSHPGADVGKVLMENEVQKTMDFVKNMLVPTDPAMQVAVASRAQG